MLDQSGPGGGGVGAKGIGGEGGACRPHVPPPSDHPPKDPHRTVAADALPLRGDPTCPLVRQIPARRAPHPGRSIAYPVEPDSPTDSRTGILAMESLIQYYFI
eukprot:7077157-Pyramimonas_sp.AAC.1